MSLKKAHTASQASGLAHLGWSPPALETDCKTFPRLRIAKAISPAGTIANSDHSNSLAQGSIRPLFLKYRNDRPDNTPKHAETNLVSIGKQVVTAFALHRTVIYTATVL